MLAENERKGGYYPSRLPSFLGFAVRPLGCLKALPSVLLVSPLRGYAFKLVPVLCLCLRRRAIQVHFALSPVAMAIQTQERQQRFAF